MEETLPPGPTSSCHVDHAHGVLKLTGDVDYDSAAAVTERVVAAVTAGVTHLDLSEVSFFGAAGVRAVLTGHEALPAHVTALRVSCSPVVLRVLQTCGLVGVGRLQIVAADRMPDRHRAQT